MNNDKRLFNKDFFFCYDKKLSRFLYDNGLRYITSAIDPKSRKRFSLYINNEELAGKLKEYKERVEK